MTAKSAKTNPTTHQMAPRRASHSRRQYRISGTKHRTSAVRARFGPSEFRFLGQDDTFRRRSTQCSSGRTNQSIQGQLRTSGCPKRIRQVTYRFASRGYSHSGYRPRCNSGVCPCIKLKSRILLLHDHEHKKYYFQAERRRSYRKRFYRSRERQLGIMASTPRCTDIRRPAPRRVLASRVTVGMNLW